MSRNYEYIKWYWNHTDNEYAVIIFYELDLENERYATRMAEVFSDRSIVPVIEERFDFITEGPVPKIDEINANPEYYAEIISKEEFETVYIANRYDGDISFPKKTIL